MQLDFISVKAHNFLSYRDLYVDLKDKGYCLVSGKNNFKEDNALSNGAGKSTFLQAICWCLTGETISGIRTELKNLYVEENDTYVELLVDVDDKQYKLVRYNQPRSDLKIYVDGEDKSGKGIRESEKVLSDLLPDLTKELIANVIILGQGLPDKFSSHHPSGRKELLEKLSKSDFMIEDIKTRISQREDTLNQSLRKVEDEQLQINTQKTLYTNQISTLKKELEDIVVIDYDSEIIKLKNDKELVLKEIKEIEQCLPIKLTEIESLEHNKNELLSKKQVDLQEESVAYNEFLENIISLLSSKKSLVTQAEQEIRKLESIKDICPTCGQKIPGIIKPDTSKNKEDLKLLVEEVNSLEVKKDSAKKKHNEYTSSINENYDDTIKNLQSQASAISIEVRNLTDKKDNLHKKLIELNSIIDKLFYRKDNDSNLIQTKKLKIDDLNSKIISLSANLEKLNKEANELSNRLSIVKKISTFVRRDFRGYLLRDVIEYLNQKLKYYSLLIFNHDNIEMLLEGTNLNIYFNNKLCEALSGGERQKIDLLIQLSIRDMLVNYLDFHSSILCLDEITDNLDEVGCTKVFDLISNELNDLDSVFIISHHSESLNIPVDTELLVTKNENGISTIEEK